MAVAVTPGRRVTRDAGPGGEDIDTVLATEVGA